ncbi:MAG: flagellar filament capping protein FliD [Rhodocyclaceae bacterium]|nr:flagellar filament capping protein FliD [Rhodocyclaceae bacterium]
MAIASSSIDVNSLVSQLMTVEQRPLTVLDAKEAGLQAKISAFGTIKSALATLQTSIAQLAKSTTFTARTATSSDPTVLSATAGNAASNGNYSITVNKLAKFNTVRSNDAYTALTNTFNTGTLSISVGGGAAKTVTIDANDNTLSGIRDAINNANAGVTASVINDGTNQRLVLTSKSMGSDGAIKVTASEDGVATGSFALTGLTYDESSPSGNPSMVQTQAADNASLTVNGLTVTRSSNTVTDVVTGLTINLTKEGNTTLSVAKNNTDVMTVVNAFVNAYNDTVKQNKGLTAYDATNKTAALLTGDATVRSIQSGLADMLQSSVKNLSGGITSLVDVGIELQKDGTLTLNTAKLTAALNDPNKDVAGLFSQTTAGNQGVAVRFNNWLNQTLAAKGAIGSRVDSFSSSISSLDDQRTALQARLVTIEARYRKQFSALDSLISSMSQTSTFLDQQLANLPSSSKK